MTAGRLGLGARRPFLAIVMTVALAAAVTTGCGGGGGGSSSVATGSISNDGKPRLVEAKDLGALTQVLGHPVYWAGDQGGKKLELTITQPGNAYVRYLDNAGELGSPQPSFLTVGTYPYKGAFAAVKANARRHGGSKTAKTPDGGFVLQTADRPQSVYIVYPGKDFEIEVYSPSASQAFQLATSGAVKPIGG
jgi:hypothetical protein